jgi:hypothetical protein
MSDKLRKILAATRREFSPRTVLFGALFIVTLVVAFFVDLDGVLEYYRLITGSPLATLEMGGHYFLGKRGSIPRDGHLHFCGHGPETKEARMKPAAL